MKATAHFVANRCHFPIWVAQQFKKKVEAYKRTLRDNEQNMLCTQMNTMFGETMRSAVVAELQERELQQRLTGPR